MNQSQRLALLEQCRTVAQVLQSTDVAATATSTATAPATIDLRSLRDIERSTIIDRLRYFQGNKTHTAASLGVAIKTLYNLMHSYGIPLK